MCVCMKTLWWVGAVKNLCDLVGRVWWGDSMVVTTSLRYDHEMPPQHPRAFDVLNQERRKARERERGCRSVSLTHHSPTHAAHAAHARTHILRRTLGAIASMCGSIAPGHTCGHVLRPSDGANDMESLLHFAHAHHFTHSPTSHHTTPLSGGPRDRQRVKPRRPR